MPGITSGWSQCAMALAEADESPADDRWLSAPERRQCAALPSAAHRSDYRAARLAARRAIVRSSGSIDAARSVAVLHAPGRAPSVWLRRTDGWHRAGVALSLAHRDGRAVAAIAPRGARVGVDVERRRAIAPERVRYFAGPEEQERGPRDAAALWALKEAVWKALGLGATCPLRSLRLEFDADGVLRTVVACGRRERAHAVLARPWPTHVVAVALVEAA